MVAVKILDQFQKQADVLLQADSLADLDEMLAANTAELGVVQQQVRKLSALLHHVDAGETGDALLEARETQQIAQHNSRIIEAQRLIEVADQQKFFCNSSFIWFHIHSS